MTKVKTINKLRAKINHINTQLVRLLNERVLVAIEIGKLKKKFNLPIYDSKREKEILKKIKSQNLGSFPNHELEKIFKEIIRVCREAEEKKKTKKKGKIVFGIQGGKGSFNEEALNHYLKRNKINNYIIKYLYTSENVLKALHKGEIDFGQFAIHNSVGGIVGESIEALAKYKIRIKEQFAIKISHALMIRKDAVMKNVTIIMTHPQVLAQCKNSLLRKYPKLKKNSGEKELVDHALVAKKMSEKKIAKNIATMGSKILAEIYDLKIVEDNLQDAKENYTSFLLAERI